MIYSIKFSSAGIFRGINKSTKSNKPNKPTKPINILYKLNIKKTTSESHIIKKYHKRGFYEILSL